MTDRTSYKNVAALVRAKHIPAKRVKAASALGLDGFNLNNSIHWPTLEKSMAEHSAEIDAYLEEHKGMSFEDLKREEKELGNQLKRLEIKKREGSYVDPEEWYQFFSDFGSELSIILKKTRKDLMEQCRGYEGVIDNAFIELFTAIKSREEKCRPK